MYIYMYSYIQILCNFSIVVNFNFYTNLKIVILNVLNIIIFKILFDMIYNYLFWFKKSHQKVAQDHIIIVTRLFKFSSDDKINAIIRLNTELYW